MEKYFSFEPTPATGKRDLLDIMESYKYMNSYLFFESLEDKRWDYATGWTELNMDREEWRSRPSPFRY